MNTKALIIHGYGGTNQGNWFPWLKAELEKLHWDVSAPNLPNTDEPKLAEQLPALLSVWNLQESSGKKRVLIGHSLGGSLVLRMLEQDWEQPIDMAIIVASTSQDSHPEEIKNYFAAPLDFEKIKKNCKKFILIFSDNDPYISAETGSYYQHQLGENAELFMIHHAGHFMKRDGYEEFPLALSTLRLAE